MNNCLECETGVTTCMTSNCYVKENGGYRGNAMFCNYLTEVKRADCIILVVLLLACGC